MTDRPETPIRSAAELPGFYRQEAARLRRMADLAETIEQRVCLLDMAERAERVADDTAD